VTVHQNRWAIPFRPGVLEVAHQFAFLAIDGDKAEVLLLKTGRQRANVLELLVPLRAGMGGDLLSIDAQREIRWVQKTSDGIGRDRDIHLVENGCDLLGRSWGVHFNPVMRSPASIVLHQ
jgi:hypothetical protein